MEAAQALYSILDEAQKSTNGAKKHTDGLQDGSTTYIFDGLGTEDGLLELEMDPIKVEKLAICNREMAVYMRRALMIALEADVENDQFGFKRCCDLAVIDIQNILNDGWLNTSTGGRTVFDWFRDFKKHRRFSNLLLQEHHVIAFLLNNPNSIQRI